VIFESIALVSGFFVTAMVGTPLAAILARSQDWLDDGGKHDHREPLDVYKGIGFEPLDLGPDLMRWPSEVERPSTSLPVPEWPSKSWDDPHFGAHWHDAQYQNVDDGAYEARQAERREATRRRAAAEAELAQRQSGLQQAQRQEAEHRKREQAMAKQRKAQSREQRRQQESEQQFFKEKASKKAKEHVQRAKKQAKQAAHKAASNAVGAEIPSPDELEAMVGQLGLAGTVQEIMKRTNWDFRKAAHYLAKARQQR